MMTSRLPKENCCDAPRLVYNGRYYYCENCWMCFLEKELKDEQVRTD